MSLRIGDIFQDPNGLSFEVTGDLGAGGFGAAFVVRDTSSGDEYIAKAPVQVEEVRVKSIQNEFNVLKELERKGVPDIVRAVSLAQFDSPNGRFPIMIMERARGITLEKAIENSPLSYEDVGDVMSKMAGALKLVHQNGYMHLDIAPDNVFIDDPGGRNDITIIDFGIAAQKSDTNTFAVEQHGFHKPFFGPPELKPPNPAASCGSDIFSVGVTGFALIMGGSKTSKIRQEHRPPPYDPIHYLPPGTQITNNAHLHDVIKKASWPERSGRFATMEDLENAVAGKEPDENFPRLVADGVAHRLIGDGPWTIGRENIFDDDNQPDIIVHETSPTHKFISRKQARIERRADGVLMLYHSGTNDTRIQLKIGTTIRWKKVESNGFPLGSRHQILCFGYADHAPNAHDKNGNPLSPGPYKVLEFFPPSPKQTGV